MDSIEKMVKDKLSDAVMGQLSKSIGVDESQTGSIIDKALPMILSGLGKNAAEEEGAKALEKALEKDHDGSIMDKLQDAIGDKDVEKDGDKILGHVFGDKLGDVTNMLGGDSKVESSIVSKIMQYLAPVVLGQIGKSKKDGGLDLGGLTDLLGSEKQHADKELGGLSKLLDRDGDGSIVDDLMDMGKGLLK